MMQLDQLGAAGRDGVAAAMQSAGIVASGTSSAMTLLADYARASFEHGTRAAEQLLGARSLDAVLDVQGEFVRERYEALVAEAGKLGELATETARGALAPMEGFAARSLRPNG